MRLDLRNGDTTPEAAESCIDGDSSGDQLSRSAAVHACVLASVAAKQAAALAFKDKGRSMTAPDVMAQVGAAFQELYPEG